MGADSFDERAVATLRRLAAEKHLSIMVGAGASEAAGLPDGAELVEKMVKQSSRGSGRDLGQVVTSLLKSQGPFLALEAAMWGSPTPRQRKEKLARALYSIDGMPGDQRERFLPRELHGAVAALAAHRRPGELGIFTTNYDDLLEKAFEARGLPGYPRYERQDPGSGDFAIQHLHGYLSSTKKTPGGKQGFVESKDVVLTQMDYLRLYGTPGRDWPTEALGEAAAKGPLVFVGTSLSDPNSIHRLFRLREARGVGHALVLTRQGLGVPQGHLRLFADRLRTQWKNIGVDVVLLEDYMDAAAFVRELAWARLPDYRDPAARVQAFWSLLGQDFSGLQRAFSGELHGQFEEQLVGRLGHEANLLLWASDGRGSLFRFAANDRVYRSRRALRRIPYRCDTGWVVSAALAFGNTTVRTPDGHSHDPEGHRLPGTRWRNVAAVPLRVELAGHPPLIVGAVTAATTRELDRREREQWGDIMVQLIAPGWLTRLSDVTASGGL